MRPVPLTFEEIGKDANSVVAVLYTHGEDAAELAELVASSSDVTVTRFHGGRGLHVHVTGVDAEGASWRMDFEQDEDEEEHPYRDGYAPVDLRVRLNGEIRLEVTVDVIA